MATCQSCICCSAVTIKPELCQELRRTGACIIQNQQRVIVLVVKPDEAARVIGANFLAGEKTVTVEAREL